MNRMASGKNVVLIPDVVKQNLDNVSKCPYNDGVNEGFLRSPFLFLK